MSNSKGKTSVSEVFVASKGVKHDVFVGTSRSVVLREIGVSERKWGVAVKKAVNGVVTVKDGKGVVWFVSEEPLLKVERGGSGGAGFGKARFGISNEY